MIHELIHELIHDGGSCQSRAKLGLRRGAEVKFALEIYNRRPNSISLMHFKPLGFFLLAIYLIIIGIEGLFGASLGILQPLVPALAIASGILILLGR